MIDFRTMTDAEVIACLVMHQGEMGADGISTEAIAVRLNDGRAAIARESSGHGAAVVEVELANVSRGVDPGAHIWLLWVDPAERGTGVGRRFVREILKKYAGTYFARVHCFGARRSRFFSRFGFRVVSTDRTTGLREMEQR